jgi:hypothetical protein
MKYKQVMGFFIIMIMMLSVTYVVSANLKDDLKGDDKLKEDTVRIKKEEQVTKVDSSVSKQSKDIVRQKYNADSWEVTSYWKEGSCWYYDLTVGDWHDARREITCHTDDTDVVIDMMGDDVTRTVKELSVVVVDVTVTKESYNLKGDMS